MTFKKFVIAILRPFKGHFCMTAKEMYLYSSAPSEEFEAAVVDPMVLDKHPHRIREIYGLRQNMRVKPRKVSALYEYRANFANGSGRGTRSGAYGSRASSRMRASSGMGSSFYSGARSSGSSQSFFTAHSSLGSV
jgi:hypothetical protein